MKIAMQHTTAPAFPQTFDEFLTWEPVDGYKYEWKDGEMIRFSGLKQKQYLSITSLVDFSMKKDIIRQEHL